MTRIIVASDTPSKPPENCTPADKSPGGARFVFISRISEKKNLLYAIALMHGNPGASLDVYGTIEDRGYWRKCEQLIAEYSLPVTYRGELQWEEVIPTLQRGHFLLLPTFGENFGHVIFEALAAGCPPLTSNQTPWSELLARECGWMIPLDMPEMWHKVISRCIAMEQGDYSQASLAAHHYAQEWFDRNVVEEYRRLFMVPPDTPPTL